MSASSRIQGNSSRGRTFPPPEQMADYPTGATRRFIGQNGAIEEGPAPKSGFILGSGSGGQPSYQYRIDARAPLAETHSGLTSGSNAMSDNIWAATFGGNSPLGVSKGFSPNNNAVARAANDVYGTPLDHAIAQGEAYHAANGLTLPDMKTVGTLGFPTGGAYDILQKYGDPEGATAAFTRFSDAQRTSSVSGQVGTSGTLTSQTTPAGLTLGIKSPYGQGQTTFNKPDQDSIAANGY